MKQNWKSWLPLGGMLFALYLAIHYWTPFCRLAQLGLQAAAPLLLGAVMAYAVNILMSMLESRLFPRGGSLSRPVSLVLAYASLAAILALVVRMVQMCIRDRFCIRSKRRSQSICPETRLPGSRGPSQVWTTSSPRVWT